MAPANLALVRNQARSRGKAERDLFVSLSALAGEWTIETTLRQRTELRRRAHEIVNKFADQRTAEIAAETAEEKKR